MRDPYITPAGNTFEKKALFDYASVHQKDPVDNAKVTTAQLMPNLSLKHCIETFLDENPWAFEHAENDSIENMKFP